MLKALFVGLLLFASGSSLCLAHEYSAGNKTASFVIAIGSAQDKFPNGAATNIQSTRGLMFDIGSSGEPFRFALDYFSGGSTETVVISGVEAEVILRVTERDLGARHYFEDLLSGLSFYLGGGLVRVSANIEVKVSSVASSRKEYFSGFGSGTYFGLGARRVFENGFSLGFDYRNSNAEFQIQGSRFVFFKNSDGIIRTSLTLGYSW